MHFKEWVFGRYFSFEQEILILIQRKIGRIGRFIITWTIYPSLDKYESINRLLPYPNKIYFTLQSQNRRQNAKSAFPVTHQSTSSQLRIMPAIIIINVYHGSKAPHPNFHPHRWNSILDRSITPEITKDRSWSKEETPQLLDRRCETREFLYRLFFSLTEPRIPSRSGNPLKVIPFDIVGGLSVKIIDVETFPIITPLSIVDQSLDNVLSPWRVTGVAFRRVSTTS